MRQFFLKIFCFFFSIGYFIAILLPVSYAEPTGVNLTQPTQQAVIAPSEKKLSTDQPKSEVATSTDFQMQSALSLPSGSQTLLYKTVPHNSNFSMAVDQGKVFLRDNITGIEKVIHTLKTGETAAGLDVDPGGKYAIINTQRVESNPDGSGGTVNTGDFLFYNMAAGQMTSVHMINPNTGADTGTGILQGRGVSVPPYVFRNGFLFVNTSIESWGHTYINNLSGVIVNLNTPAPQATKPGVTALRKDDLNFLFPSTGTQIVLGATVQNAGNEGIVFYDAATGKSRVQTLSTYGYDGIKAVSPDYKKVIAAGSVNAVFVVSVPQSGYSTVFLPNVNGQADHLINAMYTSNTEAVITTQLGKTYILNTVTLTLADGQAIWVTPPSNPNFSMAVSKGNIYLLDNKTKKVSLIGTLKNGETAADLDVDPTGKFAIVNIQRRDTTATGYVDTGNLMLYNIGTKQITAVQTINPTTGEKMSLGNLHGRVSQYGFKEGFLFINTTDTTFNGQGFNTLQEGIIVNLNTVIPQATKPGVAVLNINDARIVGSGTNMKIAIGGLPVGTNLSFMM